MASNPPPPFARPRLPTKSGQRSTTRTIVPVRSPPPLKIAALNAAAKLDLFDVIFTVQRHRVEGRNGIRLEPTRAGTIDELKDYLPDDVQIWEIYPPDIELETFATFAVAPRPAFTDFVSQFSGNLDMSFTEALEHELLQCHLAQWKVGYIQNALGGWRRAQYVSADNPGRGKFFVHMTTEKGVDGSGGCLPWYTAPCSLVDTVGENRVRAYLSDEPTCCLPLKLKNGYRLECFEVTESFCSWLCALSPGGKMSFISYQRWDCAIRLDLSANGDVVEQKGGTAVTSTGEGKGPAEPIVDPQKPGKTVAKIIKPPSF
jgi:hypothetical protein